MKKYNSVTPGTIVAVVSYVTFSFSIMAWLLFAEGINFFTMLFILLWFNFSIRILYNCFCRKIQIDDDGVKSITPFKTISIPWSEIKEIGVSRVYVGLRGGASVIYFSTKYGAAASVKEGSMITMRYRKSVLDEIKKYWSGRISERRM